MNATVTAHTEFLWEIALLLVSLDRVTPFFPELGLEFAAPNTVKDLARTFTVLRQQQLTPEPSSDDLARLSSLISDFYASLRAAEGARGVALFEAWMDRFILYDMELRGWHAAWHGLLFYLDGSQLPVLARLGLAEEKAAKLVPIAHAYCTYYDQLEDRMAATDKLPLEGWDEQQYRIYQVESPDVTPISFLSGYLSSSKFMACWEQILDLLTRSEMDILNRWGQVTAASHIPSLTGSAQIPEKYRTRA